MAFLSSTTSTIVATLTRVGRRKLASNDEYFNPTKFAFADDEINYGLMNNTFSTEVDTDAIVTLPISEPSTNESGEMLHKIFMNQSFLGQHFVDDTSSTEYITVLVSTGAQRISLHSDNTFENVKVSFNSVNAQGRNYLAPFYQLNFDTSNDFYSWTFQYPALNTFDNDNWEELGNGLYTFIKASKSGNSPYSSTPFGSPSIVLSVVFQETAKFHDLKLLPQNRNSITIPSFLTITELDVNKQPRDDIQSVAVPLDIINVQL